MRYRCRQCGEEVNPRSPLCCGAWDDLEPMEDEEAFLYESDLPVDLDGKPYTRQYMEEDE